MKYSRVIKRIADSLANRKKNIRWNVVDRCCCWCVAPDAGSGRGNEVRGRFILWGRSCGMQLASVHAAQCCGKAPCVVQAQWGASRGWPIHLIRIVLRASINITRDDIDEILVPSIIGPQSVWRYARTFQGVAGYSCNNKNSCFTVKKYMSKSFLQFTPALCPKTSNQKTYKIADLNALLSTKANRYFRKQFENGNWF